MMHVAKRWGTTMIQEYGKLAAPRYKRITLRFSFIEIELRTRPRPANERLSAAERAYRRARAEEAMGRGRYNAIYRWSMGL